MSLGDRAGLQIRPLNDSFDLSSSAALDRNGRKGLEVRGARGGRWVRVVVFDRRGGLTLVRCEGEGDLEAADAPDLAELLSSVSLGDAPEVAPDPTPPAWLPAPGAEPLGEPGPFGAGFAAAMPEAWRGRETDSSSAGVRQMPAATDDEGGRYQIACMPIHEAPTMAELLDRHSPIVSDQALEPGAARIGPRVGSVMRSVANVPSASASGGARRGKAPNIRLGMTLAGMFRFVWIEGADRCVFSYTTGSGAANPPEAFDRLYARLPDVVRVVASLSRN